MDNYIDNANIPNIDTKVKNNYDNLNVFDSIIFDMFDLFFSEDSTAKLYFTDNESIYNIPVSKFVNVMHKMYIYKYIFNKYGDVNIEKNMSTLYNPVSDLYSYILGSIPVKIEDFELLHPSYNKYNLKKLVDYINLRLNRYNELNNTNHKTIKIIINSNSNYMVVGSDYSLFKNERSFVLISFGTIVLIPFVLNTWYKNYKFNKE